ncbi:MAG: hypothetical protein HY052_04470 [Proteobacteria bacterium]|nr:hypothetical protein [Pseudomonadota bacterium]
MRKSTVLWLVLAAFCSVSLFYTSQHVHDSREKMTALSWAVSKEEESIRVLQAEWSYLNQPRRLERLAQEHLKIQTLKGAQFVQPDDLPPRTAAVPVADAPGVEVKADNTAITIKIKPPLPRAAQIHAGRPPTDHSFVSATTGHRVFGDVIKSLSVE